MSAAGRYDALPTRTLRTPEGRDLRYRGRRFLPRAETVPARRVGSIGAGDRLDLLAAVELGDANQGWVIADANGVMHPRELERPGRPVRIPFPAGIQGGVDVG